MITRPGLTPTYYSAVFEHDAAKYLACLLAPKSGNNISQVLVTSSDVTSDIEAINELENGAKTVLDAISTTFENERKFNPLYMPYSPDELAGMLEVDTQGEIKAVDDFENPFIYMELDIHTPKVDAIVSGKVCYHPFALPDFTEIFETEPVRH